MVNNLVALTIFMFMILLSITETSGFQIAKPGCDDSCGSVKIPYPFGTSEGCYYDPEFKIICNRTFDPPQTFINTANITVTEISLSGQLLVMQVIAYDCYDKTGFKVGNNLPSLNLTKFVVSNTANKFVAVGCDTAGLLAGYQQNSEKEYIGGCLSICNSFDYISDGSCTGYGCCETTIAKGLYAYGIVMTSLFNYTNISKLESCGYGFVVEKDKFKFTSQSLEDLNTIDTTLPMVLEWTIGNLNCKESQSQGMDIACQGHSECYDSENSLGYRCKCLSGYGGNPYLSVGCTDVDECSAAQSNNCTNLCTNEEGSYICSCPKGYHGDGRIDGSGCNRGQTLVIPITVGIGVGSLVLLISTTWLYWGYKKWKLIKLKEKFFEQNGGLILQQRLPKRDGPSSETIKIFTNEELKKATNNYDKDRVIGEGGFGTVYKGILTDGRTVAIKKSKVIDKTQIEQFINEVMVLSQINHRNVVKLLGCCLETEVPLLVYEFIANGTLFDHISNKEMASALNWETRLRIAAETAGVLSYLHSSASVPIVHRDIKSTNILLDESYTAKVSDFGASRLVPLDQIGISTIVQGTLGYLDPEYLHTSQLTEKSDVYSFGVVLLELLTGEKALSFLRSEDERNLSMYFVKALKENRMHEILEECVKNESKTEHVKEVADLANRCLRVRGDDRPTMKEVATELDALIRIVAVRHPLE